MYFDVHRKTNGCYMDQTTCVIIDDLPSINNHDFTVNWHNWNCQQQKYSDGWDK